MHNLYPNCEGVCSLFSNFMTRTKSFITMELSLKAHNEKQKLNPFFVFNLPFIHCNLIITILYFNLWWTRGNKTDFTFENLLLNKNKKLTLFGKKFDWYEKTLRILRHISKSKLSPVRYSMTFYTHFCFEQRIFCNV